MPKLSAGLLAFRRCGTEVEVLLVHPGGPFWAKKDLATWSVPKGLADEGEKLSLAARREFSEETGQIAPDGPTTALGYVKYGNKKVFVWATEADFDVTTIKSNKISREWPPKSGKLMEFAECDKADWFTLDVAKKKLVKGQVPFVDRLASALN